MKILVGDTGFVGSNLKKIMQFDYTFNSKNIENAYNLHPDLLVYAGVRGTKILANKFPKEDEKNIEDAKLNFTKINPKKLILISSVDVYDDLDGKNEDYISNVNNLHTYGKNRFLLEKWVEQNVKDYHIVRLPAIYGNNLKKNYIYDLISPVPKFLEIEDYINVEKEFPTIFLYYKKNGEIFYNINKDSKLSSYFLNSKYNSLRFTDSRSIYQYFDLRKLDKIVELVISNSIKVLNCVTEPIQSDLLYKKINGTEFNNYIVENPIQYKLTTKWAYLVNENKYLENSAEEIKGLINFIEEERKK